MSNKYFMVLFFAWCLMFATNSIAGTCLYESPGSYVGTARNKLSSDTKDDCANWARRKQASVIVFYDNSLPPGKFHVLAGSDEKAAMLYDAMQ